MTEEDDDDNDVYETTKSHKRTHNYGSTIQNWKRFVLVNVGSKILIRTRAWSEQPDFWTRNSEKQTRKFPLPSSLERDISSYELMSTKRLI